MMTHKILDEDGIVIVEPTGPLSEEDFAQLAESVDAFLQGHDSLRGLLIHTEHFPGWEDFDGFIHHVKFVKNHHRKIRRVALVSDSKVAAIAPRLADHFVSPDVKAFDYLAADEALAWLRQDPNPTETGDE